MSFFQKIKHFLYPLKYSKFNFFMTLIFSFLFWLVTTYSVIFLKNITNAIENKNWEEIKFWLIIWFITVSILFFINLFYRFFPFWMFRDLHSNIYNDYMKEIFKWNNNEIEKIWTWRIISIIQKWILSWINILGNFCWEWSQRFFTIVIIFFTVWKINIYVMLIWIIVLIFCIFWVYLFYPKASKWRKKWKEIDVEIDRLAVLHIMNKFEIFQNNKQNEETNKIFEKNNEWFWYRVKEKLWQGLSYNWIEYFLSVAIIFTAFYFSFLIFQWKSNFWNFVLFTWLATLLWNQIRSFTEISKNFADNYIHVEKMNEMLERIKEKDKEKDKGKSNFVFKNWDIQVKNINFAYDKNPVFSNFSMQIAWWTKTAFVWESWWWKSTMIKLLAWYIKVDSWDIIIDWQKLSSIKISDYYKHIWYLTQDPSVFDWSIYDNLTYALKNPPKNEELEKVIKLSKCEFIFEFKNWLKTEIWERWIRLSWWQKQRLAIAKIMLKNPNIILLDEPTSALDSFNEELLNKALNNLFKWKTVIIIAHRLQTVKEAQRIILFEKWKIIEDWTHKELIKLNWKYKKMLDLQSGF